MKPKLRRLLIVLLSIMFLFGLSLLARQAWDNYRASQAYKQALQYATSQPTQATTLPETTEPTEATTVSTTEETTPPEPMDEGALYIQQMDLAALQQVNPDVFGWIYLPDTQISYPILQGKDNEMYLRTTWDGIANAAGSIFLEAQNRQNFQDHNTIIYGHNMANGTMFGQLHKYHNQEFLDSHPYVYIATGDSIRRYKIFSAYDADIQSDTFRLQFPSQPRRQQALDSYLSRSILQADSTPNAEDLILTLSTCTGTGTYHSRWVVQGYLTGQWPK